MKLLVIIVQDADAPRLQDALVKNRIPVTKLSSTGGFLRRGSTTFISGVKDDQVDFVEHLVDSNSRMRTVVQPSLGDVPMRKMLDVTPGKEPQKFAIGGATVFILDVEEFEKV